MNCRIFKYKLEITDEQYVDLPKGARVLSVGEQRGDLVLWAFVDADAEKVRRVVRVLGTGNPAELRDDNDTRRSAFVGTVQERSRPLVWHVFVDDEEK